MDTTYPRTSKVQQLEPPKDGIASDCAHSVKNGITQFRGVDVRTGGQLFYENIGNKTVNIGEFLGVVTGINTYWRITISPK